MKKTILAAFVAAIPIGLSAQSAISAYQLSQADMRGTARFMSMGGAFGALGGDLSTLTQNPAGIGVYRSSEVGITFDLDIMKSKSDANVNDNTHFYVNNFGYIGAIELDSDVMPYFQWGAAFNRKANFDRTFSGAVGSLGTSMSNYVANYTSTLGYSPELLGMTESYNPYTQTSADWLSILSYNSYIINPVGNSSMYNGLFDEDRTTGNAQFSVRTRGYIDEYSINFGGNIMNTVYWGLGFGITDLDYTEESFYDEELQNARIPASMNPNDGVTTGNGYFGISNYKKVTGSGFNLKLGAIIKPINELRFGIAIHTPTWYNLSETYDGLVDYTFPTIRNGAMQTAYTDYAYFDWKLRTPWKFMVSAAGVVGGRFILSADYEYDAFKDMRVGDGVGTYDDVTSDIKTYFKPTNTVRVGAEVRLTPSLSLRAGYANVSSAVEKDAYDGEVEIYTSGTNPAYTFNQDTRYLSLGFGYRYKGFYVDAAYVNKYRKSSYQPFTSFEDSLGWVYNPFSDITTSENNIVVSLGYKF